MKRLKITKKITVYCIIVIIAFLLLNCMYTESKASTGISTDAYTNIYNTPSGASKIDTLGSKIIGIIDAVASVVAIIMLVYIGLKYMTETPEGKANLKDGKLRLFVIGAVILFGGAKILTFIANNFWTNI